MRPTPTVLVLLAALTLATNYARSQTDGARGAGPAASNQAPSQLTNEAQKKPQTCVGGKPGCAASATQSGSAQHQQAKTKPPNPSITLSEVVVTATRIRQPLSQVGTSVTVIPASLMQEQKIDRVSEALRQTPGVEVAQTGSPGTVTGVSIRGSTTAQTLILLDGADVNSNTIGDFDAANLTTDNLAQVEVLRGAGGALYGSQAIGGVVNLISQEGEGAPRWSLLSEGGNRATQRQVLTGSGSLGHLGYSGSLSYFSTTGFRPINDSSDNLSGALRLDYHLGSDTTLRGFARYIRSNVSLVNSSIAFGDRLDPDAHQRGEFMLYKGEIEHDFTDRLVAKLSAFFVRNQIRFNDFPDSGNRVFDTSNVPEETRAANAEVLYTWSQGSRSLAGFDFHDRWARFGDNSLLVGFPPAFITAFHHERQEYAGYLEQELSLLDGRVIATGGTRVDGNSDFGEEVSPAWAMVIPIARIGASLRASYSEGFRAPSFDDLFFPNFGNPQLKPEISSEYDGGITKQLGELASLSVIYFSRRIHNLILPVPCPVGPGCLFGSMAGNAGRVDTQGVEFIPVSSLWRGLQLSGNFTYLDETHRSTQPNNVPIRAPRYAASSTLRYAGREWFRSADSITADLVYIFVGDRDDVTPEGWIRDNAAYHRFDLTLSYSPGMEWRRIRAEQVYARVQNLLDRNYAQVFAFKSPPINFVAGVVLVF